MVLVNQIIGTAENPLTHIGLAQEVVREARLDVTDTVQATQLLGAEGDI